MEYIRLTVEGPIAVVTIHRPACRNALNSQVYREIIAALQDVRDREDVRVVLLTGAGDKAFAAGADIAQMVQESPQSGRRLSALCHEAAELLETMRQVTIAAVNGYALGGGCELTLACDLRIASDRAKFGLPEVTLGIIPGGGGTQRLPRLIGVARAKELIFTGGVIDAKEADRIGLVNRVVPHDDLMDTCRSLAKTIAQNAGYAVSLAKEAINASGDTDLKNGLRREADLLGLAFATHDKQEGMTAFLEHREPDFTDF